MNTVDSVVRLAIPAASAVAFRIRRMEAREALHQPWRVTLRCELRDANAHDRLADVDPTTWLGSEATVAFDSAQAGERKLVGIIEEVAFGPSETELTIVPKLFASSDTSDYRVFVDKNAVDVTKEVLKDHGVSVDDRVATAPAKYAQYVQAFESDLSFVRRVLADQGIAFFASADGSGVVLSDNPQAFERLPAALPVRPVSGMGADEAVFLPRLQSGAVVQKVALRDYDFERPLLDLNVDDGDEGPGLTWYEFPGGYVDPAEGTRLAQARRGELARGRLVLNGETNSRMFRAGSILEINEGEPAIGEWLLVSVQHEIVQRQGDAHPYRASFVAVPAEDGYRPDRLAAPRLGGIEHAVVTGSGSAEIHTEQHARVRVSQRWDRRSPGDDGSSAWVRTVQPNTSGSILLPRTGWETLIGFGVGTGDEPFVLGRVYNAVTPPPVSQPAGKVQSALTSRTTPGGGSANRIATDDSSGGEAMTFEASKDLNERAENDKVTDIGADATLETGAAQRTAIGTVLTDQVDGSRSGSIALYHGVNVGANYSMGAADEVVIVGGLRLIRTGGNNGTICTSFTRIVGQAEVHVPIEHQTRTVHGASLVMNAGNWNLRAGMTAGISVGGASALSVAGVQAIETTNYSCNVKGLLSEKYATRTVHAGGILADKFRSSGKLKTSGAAKLTGNTTFEASSKIVIKAGGVIITMTSSEIKIDGRYDGDSKSFKSSPDTKYG